MQAGNAPQRQWAVGFARQEGARVPLAAAANNASQGEGRVPNGDGRRRLDAAADDPGVRPDVLHHAARDDDGDAPDG
eukprot:9390488-Pyramimonas_sp.AAC.1